MEEFRQNTSMVVLSKLLENPELLYEDYKDYKVRDTSMSHMNIYEFAATIAVEYTDALINRLSK